MTMQTLKQLLGKDAADITPVVSGGKSYILKCARDNTQALRDTLVQQGVSVEFDEILPTHSVGAFWSNDPIQNGF